MNNTLGCIEMKNGVSAVIAKMAVRALYFEMKAYPKPGLVSFRDSGAHHDMTGELLYRSMFSLRHYFYQITKQGLLTNCVDTLRFIGVQAEERMLQKTQGVNTHRGAIFALGLLCVSASRLIATKRLETPENLHQQLLADWSEFLITHSLSNHSHGAVVRQKYKIIDAKEMAIRGYDIIFSLLPTFLTLYLESQSLDDACLYAYLILLTQIDDTNILYRKGQTGLNFARATAGEVLTIDCWKTRRQRALEIHHVFSCEGISPGGVADLMAVLLFIGQLFCEQLRCQG